MPAGMDNFEVLRQYLEEVIKPHFKIEFPSTSRYSQMTDSNEFAGHIVLPMVLVHINKQIITTQETMKNLFILPH